MATFLFLLLHALKQLNSVNDTYIFCLLVALEFPSYLRLYVWWQTTRR